MKNNFFEWVEPHLIRVKSLSLIEFFMNIVWIKAGWMSVASMKSMKGGFWVFAICSRTRNLK